MALDAGPSFAQKQSTVIPNGVGGVRTFAPSPTFADESVSDFIDDTSKIDGALIV
jgi:hypothetical protein